MLQANADYVIGPEETVQTFDFAAILQSLKLQIRRCEWLNCPLGPPFDGELECWRTADRTIGTLAPTAGAQSSHKLWQPSSR